VTWIVVLTVGVGSYLFRVGPLLAIQRMTLPPRAERVIRHAGTAAITALIVVAGKQSAAGGSVLPTILALAAGIGLACRGAAMTRILVVGGALYAGVAVGIGLLG
jgi:branched-subunit amino acid transport protein